jgi:hypothetical protein
MPYPPIPASELLARAASNSSNSSIDSWSNLFLVFIDRYLDQNGAWEWNSRVIAIISATVLLVVRWTIYKKGGIEWHAFLHALVTGIGSLVCFYLDQRATPILTGLHEPLRSLRCYGCLTSLHRILPAITMGYSIFDLLDGIRLGPDFMIHGIATLAVFSFYVEHQKEEFMAPMLLMEVSTIFLACVKANFVSPIITAIIQLSFVICFFTFRIVVTPYLWAQVMWILLTEKHTVEYQSCFPWYFQLFSFLLGITFHCLNSFWFYKIIKKVMRKMAGVEDVQDGNHLTEHEAKSESDAAVVIKSGISPAKVKRV